MSDTDLLLRTATLIDEAYHVVKKVVVPKDIEWPPYIRFEGRIFAIYHHARQDTIDSRKEAARTYPYREVKIRDANLPVWDAVAS